MKINTINATKVRLTLFGLDVFFPINNIFINELILFSQINVALYSMEPIKKLFSAKVFNEYEERRFELDLLQNHFLQNIPGQIQPHVKVKNRIGGLLIIEVTSNNVAHKIKMTSASILKKINNNTSLKLDKIKIKITVQSPTPQRQANKTSISSIVHMKNLSKEIADSPLKTYLMEIFKK